MPSTSPSLYGSGSVTAPGAGATLAGTATDTDGGLYDVEILIALTGTAETQLRNIRLFAGATLAADNLPSISALGWMSIKLRVELDPASSFGLVAIAAATAGAVYNVVLLATPIIT